MKRGAAPLFRWAKRLDARSPRQLPPRFERSSGGGFGGMSKSRHVAHFTAGPRLAFAIQVQLDIGQGAGLPPRRFPSGPEIAQQVNHRGGAQLLRRSQRQATNRTDLLLELASHVSIDRQVSGVMWARGQLVDQQVASLRHEELHAQHADHFQSAQHAGAMSAAAAATWAETLAGASDTSRMCWRWRFVIGS